MTVKQIAVRLPRLLDKDLGEVRRLRPSGQSIEMNITPLSTASLMLDDKSGVPFRSFVEIYNAKGSAGVYRVCRPDESYGSGVRLELEHGICTLDDAVVHGKGEISGTPHSVLESILTHQTTKARGQNLWAAGTVEATGTVAVEHDGTKTLEMLIRLIGELEGYMLTFDQSGFPWRVNVLRKPTTASCEGRLSRNIRTIRKTIDDSDLCTRLYCSQLEGGYIESDTIGAWGEVEQEVSLNDDTPQSDVQAFCRRYLENRKNPTVSIEVDALEWYAMTGERLDRFKIGDVCRLALPDYGVTLEERIVSLRYMDAIGRPEAVTITLANQIKDLSTKTAETSRDIESLKSTSTSYGNRLSTSENNITNLKIADEGFKEVDNKVVKWFSSAEIDLDADETGANVGILATYRETYDLFEEVGERVAEAELILHGGPDGATAGLIARVDDNEALIKATATELETELELKADKITLNGYVTASQLQTEFSNFESGISNDLYVSALSANNFECSSLRVGGEGISLGRKTFLTSNTTLTVNSTGGTVTGVKLNKSTDTVYFLDWE